MVCALLSSDMQLVDFNAAINWFGKIYISKYWNYREHLHWQKPNCI